ENCTSRLSERAEAGRTLDLSRLYSEEAGVMLVERREQVIAIWLRSTGNGRNPMFSGRRQPSCGGTSRISREAYVRFCERLGVKFPGPTRHSPLLDILPTPFPCPLRVSSTWSRPRCDVRFAPKDGVIGLPACG